MEQLERSTVNLVDLCGEEPCLRAGVGRSLLRCAELSPGARLLPSAITTLRIQMARQYFKSQENSTGRMKANAYNLPMAVRLPFAPSKLASSRDLDIFPSPIYPVLTCLK